MSGISITREGYKEVAKKGFGCQQGVGAYNVSKVECLSCMNAFYEESEGE